MIIDYCGVTLPGVWISLHYRVSLFAKRYKSVPVDITLNYLIFEAYFIAAASYFNLRFR